MLEMGSTVTQAPPDKDEVTVIRSNCGQDRNKNDKPTKISSHSPCKLIISRKH